MHNLFSYTLINNIYTLEYNNNSHVFGIHNVGLGLKQKNQYRVHFMFKIKLCSMGITIKEKVSYFDKKKFLILF